MAEIVDKPVGFVKKHKTGFLAGAGILVIFILYIIIRGTGGGGSSSQAADSSGITDPNAATGFNPANGIVQGPPGMAGPPGPGGSRGPAGSGKFSFYAEARRLLIARGNKHPTKAQIERKRRQLIKNADKGGGGSPTMHPGAQAPVSPAVNLAANTTHYTVKPGDTTASIGAKHGLDPSTIHGANRTVM